MNIDTMTHNELKKAYLELDAKHSKAVARIKKFEAAHQAIKAAVIDPDLEGSPNPPAKARMVKLGGF